MKSKSSVLVLFLLAASAMPAFAWRPWFRPRVVVPVVPPRVVAPVVAPAPRGASPVAVQRQLAARGYYQGAIDGIFGPGSRAALRAFQADTGLAATGEINGPTLRALGL